MDKNQTIKIIDKIILLLFGIQLGRFIIVTQDINILLTVSIITLCIAGMILNKRK